ncbi:hypothetical protein [Sebaldella sp. S0638]|uniref:hypothetical protein n=1 Tax=Sebaldella sp. S0638 TaxID=2957809 RepID=UPI00209CB699|nr:hypothetical protein [Sebaldella sp. S0638]MCP1222853.1 hypothetical protein [Sebaldella sp. S0638]
MDRNRVIAEIPEYHLNKYKLRRGFKFVYMRSYEFLTSLFLVVLIAALAGAYYFTNVDKYKYLKGKYYIAACIVIVIVYLIFCFITFRMKILRRSSKIIKSIPNNLLGLTLRIKFYLDRVEFDSEDGGGALKYEDFYRIVKLDDGYLFLSAKKVFHYFEYSEIKTLYNLDYLDSVLAKYY